MGKRCFHCNINYTPVRADQIYCSENCRRKSYYESKRNRDGKEYTPQKKITCQKCWVRMKKKKDKYVCPKCNRTFLIDSLSQVIFADVNIDNILEDIFITDTQLNALKQSERVKEIKLNPNLEVQEEHEHYNNHDGYDVIMNNGEVKYVYVYRYKGEGLLVKEK